MTRSLRHSHNPHVLNIGYWYTSGCLSSSIYHNLYIFFPWLVLFCVSYDVRYDDGYIDPIPHQFLPFFFSTIPTTTYTRWCGFCCKILKVTIMSRESLSIYKKCQWYRGWNGIKNWHQHFFYIILQQNIWVKVTLLWIWKKKNNIIYLSSITIVMDVCT